jgi:N-acylneuraminate cytidylyltransferase
MKTFSLILARGGSKGIPNKNIIKLGHIPLIQYSIEASKASSVDQTWVSTDSLKIRDTAAKLGAFVINRPDEISQDNSKSDEALVHFAKNIDFDILVFIQPTSPLLKAKDIDKGIQMMKDYDSVFSVYKEHWIPEWNLNGTPYHWDIANRPMRQDVPETYVENGAFYITTKKALLNSGLRYSGRIGMTEMPKNRSFQIDTPDDLELVKKLLY